MKALGDQLALTMPNLLLSPRLAEWNHVAASIKSFGLEDGLSRTPPSSDLEALRLEVERIVSESEATVIAEVFGGKRTLRFTRLLKHLLRPKSGVQVVTTNYDRLLEVAAEEAGLGVDAMFSGDFCRKP